MPMMVVTAKRPMTMGSSAKPSTRALVWKVNRGMLSTGALPTKDTAMPSMPASRDLKRLAPLMQMIRSSAKNTNEKNSKGCSFTATLAMVGAAKIRITSENMVPRKEKSMPVPSARWASPFTAMGWPS